MSDSRPWLLAMLPRRLGMSLVYRWYGPRAHRYRPLFLHAPLAFAPGMTMYDLIPGDAISTPIAFTGIYEMDLSEQIARIASSEGLMVDVGANMGYFTLLWASRSVRNRVYAFEPDSRCAAILRNNIVANGMVDRVTIIEKACAESSGSVRFTIPVAEQTGWQGIAPAGPVASTREVPATTLDDEFLDSGVPIAVLKIDTEGANTLVLKGASRLLEQQRIGCVFFEQNTVRMAELGVAFDEAQALLTQRGYLVERVDEQGFEWVAYAPGYPRKVPGSGVA